MEIHNDEILWKCELTKCVYKFDYNYFVEEYFYFIFFFLMTQETQLLVVFYILHSISKEHEVIFNDKKTQRFPYRPWVGNLPLLSIQSAPLLMYAIIFKTYYYIFKAYQFPKRSFNKIHLVGFFVLRYVFFILTISALWKSWFCNFLKKIWFIYTKRFRTPVIDAEF